MANKVYNKYDDKYWEDVIIPEYMKPGMNFVKTKQMFNVSDKDVNKRLKGLKFSINVGDTNNRLTLIDIDLPSVLSGKRRMVRVRCECGKEFDTKYHDMSKDMFIDYVPIERDMKLKQLGI